MKFFSRKWRSSTRGFTLAEVTVASIIFGLSMVVISYSTINFYTGKKRQIARDALIEESKALMDRMVQEIRTKTIDYDEYFNQIPYLIGNSLGAPDQSTATTGGDYGKFYRQYYHHFWYIDPSQDDVSCGEYGVNDPRRYDYDVEDPCYDQHVNEGYFSTFANIDTGDDDASLSALQGGTNKAELYLISADGKQKTILKRIPNGFDDDYDGTTDEQDPTDTGEEQVGIIILDLKDQYDNETIKDNNEVFTLAEDGYYDCWAGDQNFRVNVDEVVPIAISPPNMEIKELKFFVTPIEDPRKAFNESGAEVQVHPSVTILLTTQVSSESSRQFRGALPQEITLQTTVSSRIYENVEIPFEFSGTNPGGDCIDPVPSAGAGGSCDNGVIDGTDQCEHSPENLGGATCNSLGFVWGTPACNTDCQFDTTGCYLDPPETCVIAGVGTCDGKQATICIFDSGDELYIIGGPDSPQLYDPGVDDISGWGGSTDDVFIGSEFDDHIQVDDEGTSGIDTICGLGGDDEIYGGNQADRIFGGPGNDTIYGGNHDDFIWGGPGIDTIWGGQHDDTIYGEGDDDFLYGEGHSDTIDGGSEYDTCVGESKTDCEA